MKTLLCTTTIVALMASPVFAGEMVFPSDAPVASATFPDDWQPQETDTGIDVTSPDDAIYFAIDVTEPADINKTMHEAQVYLKSKGVALDLSSAKQTNGPLNGRQLISIELDGTDEDGPVTITIGILMLSDAKTLVLTYWGTKDTQDNGSFQTVVTIVKSIKPAG